MRAITPSLETRDDEGGRVAGWAQEFEHVLLGDGGAHAGEERVMHPAAGAVAVAHAAPVAMLGGDLQR